MVQPPKIKLPKEWDGLIPPSMIDIMSRPVGLDDQVVTRPAWNQTWLKGLEEFVRRVVREELRKEENDER